MMVRPLIQAWFVKSGSFGLAIALLWGAIGVNQSSVAQSALVAQVQQNQRKAEADRLHQQGNQQYQTSQYQAALRSWEQALQIYREVRDQDNEAKILNDLGLAYKSLSRYEQAIDYYNQALRIFEVQKDQAGIASALNNLGNASLFLSRYEQAIDYYNQALHLYQSAKDQDGKAQVVNNLGLAYAALSRYKEAIVYYNTSLFLYQSVEDQAGIASALNNLGNAYLFLSQYEQAIDYYNQALHLHQAARNQDGKAKALFSLGNAYASLSRYEEATGYYNQALLIFHAVGNHQDEANALTNLGHAYASLSRYEQATGYYNQALSIYQAVHDRDGEARLLNNLGIIQIKTHQFPQAEQALRQAIQVFETVRLDSLADENKISLFEEQSRSYRALQEVLIALKKPDAALEIAERGRARALVELLAKRLSPNVAASPILSPTSEQIQHIAQTQNATLVQYSMIYEDTPPIQGKAQYKESQLYIWVISPHGKVSFRAVDLNQAQNHSLLDLVETSREALGARSRDLITTLTPKVSPAQGTQNLQSLHKILINPIADLLPRNPNDRVVFIPQSELFLVPFAALQDANGKYLIEQHTILTAPSIQVLDLTRQQRKEVAGIGKALVVGNPTMPSVAPAPGEKPEPLPALPGAEKEANAIAPLLHTHAITGDQATESAIVQQMQQADIIHLATHASFDAQQGLSSAIALAPNPNHSSFEHANGLLTAEEILNLKLKANLVVLSACDTGRGRITGDGVIGLSRSLITAGVPSVIASLWSVPDAPTAELMSDFYHYWQERHFDKAQALRQAMLDTMKTHPNPIDWAAFTLIGEAQ